MVQVQTCLRLTLHSTVLFQVLHPDNLDCIGDRYSPLAFIAIHDPRRTSANGQGWRARARGSRLWRIEFALGTLRDEAYDLPIGKYALDSEVLNESNRAHPGPWRLLT